MYYRLVSQEILKKKKIVLIIIACIFRTTYPDSILRARFVKLILIFPLYTITVC